MESSLTRVALYRRRIRASSERVWENVRDWEHLPWLHAASFRSIALEDSGDWGWRASIGLHGGQDIRLELVIEGERYVSRTLEGAGAGSEIWTTVRPHTREQTDIEVEFCVPGVDAAQTTPLGDMYLRLYTQLWDEDERMMRERSRRLDARAIGPEAGLDLGPEVALRASLPRRVELDGRPYQIVEQGDALVVYAAVCPHWLGPLGPSAADGSVTCPWHGYRFDVKSGRRCDIESPMRLPPPPRLEITSERVRLVPR